MVKYWVLLLVAILLEVVASSVLKSSAGFKITHLGILSLVIYAVSFYLLSLVIIYIPLGVAYAIWSGLGVFFVSLIGVFLYNDHVSMRGYIGIGIITIGVIITCFSTLKS